MTRITIRPLRLTDADDIHELMHMPNVLWSMSLLPSTTQEEWRLTIEQWIRNEHVHVGQGRSKHVGNLFMAVHDKHQGQGIGKMLMLTVIDLADNWLNLVRLKLDVYTDNERALHLYKNFDFEIEGRLRAESYRNGKYIDSYVMGRLRPHVQSSYSEVATQIPATPPTAPLASSSTSTTEVLE